MEQVSSQVRASSHFPGNSRQNSQMHQTSRTANNSNNCHQPIQLSDKDLHVMILHFLYRSVGTYMWVDGGMGDFVENHGFLV